MNWLAFAAVAYALVGLERGVRDAIALGPVAPSLVLPLAAFVALSAAPMQAMAACLVLGLALDLTGQWAMQAGGGVQSGAIIGPYALGAVVLCQVVLALRGVLVRNHLATLAVLTFLGTAALHAVVVLVALVQLAWGTPLAFEPAREALVRLGASAYTALLAVPIGFMLAAIHPLLGLGTARPWRARGGQAPAGRAR